MNQTLQKHAKDALMVQNACNLSGVVHSFDKAVTDLWEEANRIGKGTAWVNTHPIVQAYVDKLASLARVQDNIDNVFDAFEACRKIAEE